MKYERKTQSEEETVAFGSAFGKLLEEGDVVALQGDLGAGKTHFVQGIAQGMGICEPVVSPTFTILNYYDGPVPLQHFDFYRLEREEELEALGFADYLGSGVTVIEWSEKFPERLPAGAVIVTIEKLDDLTRIFKLHFQGNSWQKREKEVSALCF